MCFALQACLLHFACGDGWMSVDAEAAASPGSDALRLQMHQSETELALLDVFPYHAVAERIHTPTLRSPVII